MQKPATLKYKTVPRFPGTTKKVLKDELVLELCLTYPSFFGCFTPYCRLGSFPQQSKLYLCDIRRVTELDSRESKPGDIVAVLQILVNSAPTENCSAKTTW